jgi:hypothetical protein
MQIADTIVHTQNIFIVLCRRNVGQIAKHGPRGGFLGRLDADVYISGLLTPAWPQVYLPPPPPAFISHSLLLSVATEARFIVSDWGDKVEYGIELSYRPVRLHRLVGR